MRIDEKGNLVLTDSVHFAPLRNFKSFLADSFSAPAFHDLPKWNKRITTNLLYFQSNYFVSLLVLLVLFSMHSREELVWGTTVIGMAAIVAFLALTQRPEIKEIRTSYPYPVLGGLLIAAYFLLCQLPSVLYLAAVVLFTLALVLLHASLRSTNLAGRLNLELENVHLRNTVMAQAFRGAGIEIK